MFVRNQVKYPRALVLMCGCLMKWQSLTSQVQIFKIVSILTSCFRIIRNQLPYSQGLFVS